MAAATLLALVAGCERTSDSGAADCGRVGESAARTEPKDGEARARGIRVGAKAREAEGCDVGAADRHALVIGNSEYAHGGALANPGHDAQAVSTTLEALDFASVEVVLDADAEEMDAALKRFVEHVDRDDVALVFFAGHGVEADGTNYLLGVEFRGESEAKASDDDVLPLDDVVEAVGRTSCLGIVVVDACRNDPFSARWGAGDGESRGFRRPNRAALPPETYVAFSTEPGRVALDGSGDNSPFTAHLTERLAEDRLELDHLFRVVRADVLDATSGEQRPTSSHNMTGLFYFVGGPVADGQSGVQSSGKSGPEVSSSSIPDNFDCQRTDAPIACLRDRCHEEPPVASACVELGDRARSGEVPTRDDHDAQAAWERACEAGDALGCDRLGRLFLKGGRGIDRDYERARSLFERACEADLALGCIHLADIYKRGRGVPEDVQRALRTYTRLCEDGSMQACSRLGWSFHEGLGPTGEPDDKRAVALFEKACDARQPHGCLNLGWMYDHGLGVERDPVAARRGYAVACDGGKLMGCNNLASLYLAGDGVEEDRVKARLLFERACRGRVRKACENLETHYGGGD